MVVFLTSLRRCRRVQCTLASLLDVVTGAKVKPADRGKIVRPQKMNGTQFHSFQLRGGQVVSSSEQTARSWKVRVGCHEKLANPAN